MYEKLGCYINGAWRTETGKGENVINPADESVLAFLPHATIKDLEDALESAKNGFNIWKNTSVQKRAETLQKTADLIEKRSEQISRIITLEQGKPLKESQGELQRTVETFRWNAEYAMKNIQQRSILRQTGLRQSVRVEPVGVSVGLTPWNFPAFLVARKLAPALAAGCPIVIKPASSTPFTATGLVELADRAGIPNGVINLLSGSARAIGQEMTRNPTVRKLSFTGSTEIGKELMSQCSGTVKKVALELGGNAPLIVFNDCNIDQAVAGAMAAKYRNTGQACVCANRILVQDGVYDEFSKKFAQSVGELKVGPGLEQGVTQGPLIDMAAVEKVEEHIKDALEKTPPELSLEIEPLANTTRYDNLREDRHAD